MNFILALVLLYIIFLFLLIFVNNKIIKDSKKILHTISQNIDDIIYKIVKYIHSNTDKISDTNTLQEVIFSSQKQYLNSDIDIYDKEIFYNKLTDNLDYIYSLTWDDLRDIDSQKNIKKWFEILQNNEKITQALRVIVSIWSIGILYLFCEKL